MTLNVVEGHSSVASFARWYFSCSQRNGAYSEWFNRKHHGFDTAAYTQTDPPGGSTGAVEESDNHDCLVAAAVRRRRPSTAAVVSRQQVRRRRRRRPVPTTTLLRRCRTPARASGTGVSAASPPRSCTADIRVKYGATEPSSRPRSVNPTVYVERCDIAVHCTAFLTKSSATADGPRDALYQSKSCQLLRWLYNKSTTNRSIEVWALWLTHVFKTDTCWPSYRGGQQALPWTKFVDKQNSIDLLWRNLQSPEFGTKFRGKYLILEAPEFPCNTVCRTKEAPVPKKTARLFSLFYRTLTCDRRAQTQTRGHRPSQYRACVASRGKNHFRHF